MPTLEETDMSELQIVRSKAKWDYPLLVEKLGEDEFAKLVELIEKMVEAGKADVWKDAERAFRIR